MEQTNASKLTLLFNKLRIEETDIIMGKTAAKKKTTARYEPYNKPIMKRSKSDPSSLSPYLVKYLDFKDFKDFK